MSKDDMIKDLNAKVAEAHKNHDWDTVIAGLDAILAINPDDFEALSDKGSVLSIIGRADEAIAYLERAAALNPDSEHIWSNLGCAYSHLENIEKAVAAFDRALEINPENRVTAFNKMLALAIKAANEGKE